MQKILVVDDDHALAITTAEILRVNGYEAEIAFDGYQALTIARQAKPDLVVLDIMMPAGGGVKVYQNLKLSLKTSAIPIIFATAVAREEVTEKIGPIGPNNFLQKPFEAETLVEKIKSFLG